MNKSSVINYESGFSIDKSYILFFNFPFFVVIIGYNIII